MAANGAEAGPEALQSGIGDVVDAAEQRCQLLRGEVAVNEPVTNTREQAPRPCLLTLPVSDGPVEVTVWDSTAVRAVSE
ncbi:hypothetical protein [Streptomyces griseorubiginosus]|uniref:hypothetical protein n=1 Tax=Streptomyces griseorubiginosus TaxID=67304 RepID=UPI00364F3DFD